MLYAKHNIGSGSEVVKFQSDALPETKRAYGASLASQGLIVLIGRDMLANCVLVYNGPDSSFSLSL